MSPPEGERLERGVRSLEFGVEEGVVMDCGCDCKCQELLLEKFHRGLDLRCHSPN